MKAFLTGVASLIDLKGEVTYRRMETLMPPPARSKTIDEIMLDVSAQMRILLAQLLK